MPIYQRKSGIWYIDIVTQSGKRIRRGTGTTNEAEAQELLKYEQWRIDRIGDKPAHSWDEACLRFIKEKAHKRSLNDDKTKIRLLMNFRGKALEDLSRDFIMEEVSKLKCSDSTKNRYLIFIRALLNKCAGEWERIDKTPKLTFNMNLNVVFVF